MTPRAPSRRPALLALLWAAASLALPRALLAQEAGEIEPEERGSIRLDEIVVTDEAQEEDEAAVSTVDRETIERVGAHTVAEALDSVNSIHTTTGSRGERTLLLRGFDQRQTLVLVDGLPAYVPYDGSLDLSMLPAGPVDHVTVVEGPASVLYGPNGLGGAINVVTRRPGDGPLLQGSFEADRLGSIVSTVTHSLRLGSVGYTLDFGAQSRPGFPLSSLFDPTSREDGGLRENSDRRNVSVNASIAWQARRHHELRASGFYVDGAHGVPPSTTGLVPRWWRTSGWHGAGASLAHLGSYRRGVEVDETLYVRLFDSLIDSYDDGSYTTQLTPGAFHSWYHDQIAGGRVRLRAPLGGATRDPALLRLWASLALERHTREERAAEPESAYSRVILTLAPELELRPWRRLRASAGFQVDVEIPSEVPELDPETRVGLGPLLSLRLTPASWLALTGTVARRTRFPTLKERFSFAMGTREPNPDLGPESAWHLGLEVEWRIGPWVELAVSASYAELEGLIVHVPLRPGVEQLQNASGARIASTEVSLGVSPWGWLRLRAAYTYALSRRTDLDPPDDRIEHRPEHLATLEAVIDPCRWAQLSTRLSVVGPQAFQNLDTRAWGTLGTYVAWDARIDAFLSDRVQLWLRVTNLLDANYQVEYGFPEPGWELWVGAQLTCGPGCAPASGRGGADREDARASTRSSP